MPVRISWMAVPNSRYSKPWLIIRSEYSTPNKEASSNRMVRSMAPIFTRIGKSNKLQVMLSHEVQDFINQLIHPMAISITPVLFSGFLETVLHFPGIYAALDHCRAP